MPEIAQMSAEELAALRQRLLAEYEAFRAQGRRLDMTRGKPAPEQLDLANALLGPPGNGDFHAADGSDVRNYFGDLRGLPEARALFTDLLGMPADRILIGGNSSPRMTKDNRESDAAFLAESISRGTTIPASSDSRARRVQ